MTKLPAVVLSDLIEATVNVFSANTPAFGASMSGSKVERISDTEVVVICKDGRRLRVQVYEVTQ